MIAERVITLNHRKDDGELDVSLLQTRYSTLRPTRVTSVKLTWFLCIGNLWQSRRPYALCGRVHDEIHCRDLGLESIPTLSLRTKQALHWEAFSAQEISLSDLFHTGSGAQAPLSRKAGKSPALVCERYTLVKDPF